MTDAETPRGARVRVENVVRSFGALRVIDGASLTVEPGELVAMTGASGCGKSTLLQLIGGLDHPQSGEIWIDEVCVSSLRRPVSMRRHDVGFVFQLHHLLPALTAQANVELPLVAQHIPKAERHKRALEALEAVDLADRAHHTPSELSGGERQRVAIARAIVHGPRLLLADEPTGALDAASAALVLQLLDDLRTERKMTVIVVSHDPRLGGHADRLLVIEDGAVVERSLEGAVPA